MIDAGANIGTFTLGLAPDIDGALYAFEAQPVIANMLAGSVALSQRTNIQVHNMALGRFDGTIEVPRYRYDAPMEFGSVEMSTQMERLHQTPQPVPYRVPMIKIDSLGLDHVDFIKIDVEGMELDVLVGAERTLRICKPILFIEVLKSDQGIIGKFLQLKDYRVEPVPPNDWLCYPISR